MIEQQLGFSLESFLRGIVGISTVLGVAYLMSYDRKRVDWKLVGGGLFMQFGLWRHMVLRIHCRKS